MWPAPPESLSSQLLPMLARSPGKISVACHHLETGERWAIAPNPLPAASLIKLPLAIAAYQAAERGELPLLQRVEVAPLPGDDEAEFDNLGLAPAGVRSSWKKVIDRMLTESDNAATNALIDRLGLDAITSLCQAAGLGDTVLARRMLDSGARAAGRENMTSAPDMVRLLVALVRGELLNRDHTLELLSVLGQQRDLDKLASGLPAGLSFANKTGELDGYRHDAGVVDFASPSGGWAVAALGAGGPELDGALGAVMSLLDAHFSAERRAHREAVEWLEAERVRLVPDPRLAYDALSVAWRDGERVIEGVTTVSERLASGAALTPGGPPQAGAPCRVAGRLLTGRAGVVAVPCLQLRRGPGHSQELVSQARLGDPLSLLDEGPDWTLLRAADGYVAYGKTNNVHPESAWAPSHVVAAPIAHALSDRERVLQLSAGTRVQRVAPGSYRLPSGERVALDAADVRWLGERGDVDALLALARRFLGLPYLWGGATGWGLDCSGLVQLCHFVFGVELPRDADQQEAATVAITDVAALRPGDLVFFPGHVGLWLGEQELLHASAQAGMVTINSFDPADARFEPWLAEHFTRGGRSPLPVPAG